MRVLRFSAAANGRLPWLEEVPDAWRSRREGYQAHGAGSDPQCAAPALVQYSVVGGQLQRVPARRYQAADEMGDELRAIREELPARVCSGRE